MKKIFEKYDLLKIAGIFILIAIVLTWIVPSGYYQEGGMVKDEINRIGLTNVFQQGLVSFTYFASNVTFLLCLGAFYEVISRAAGYQKLVDSLSKKVKGHEKVFVVISMLIFGILASIMNEYFPILLFVPFIIAILNRVKVPKISAFLATFGGILLGIFGNICSTKVVGILDNVFRGDAMRVAGSAKVDSKILIVQIILFICAFIILAYFAVKKIKTNNDKKAASYDRFDIENVKSPKKNPTMWPYVVSLVLIFFTTVLAYMPWTSALWDIKVFEDATKWVNELALFGSPIISYIFGEFTAFGAWDLFTIQYVMLAAILLVLIFGRFSFDDILDSIAEGIKKIAPVVVVFLFVYGVLVFSAQFPVIPVIIDKIASITKGFNSVIAFISAFITSIFGVEMQYVASLSGTYYAAEASKHTKELYLIYQSAFGFASFFMPTSAALMLGLSYLNIPYKDYFKFIWKFLVAMLIIIGIIIIII